jgi:membrane associated rhomboid family serine protease
LLVDVPMGMVLATLVAPWRALLIAPPLIGLGVLWWRPDIDAYGGLSGVSHTWAAQALVGVATLHRGAPRVLAGSLLVGLIAKIVVEVLVGAAAASSLLPPGVSPVPEAHLLGVVAGVALGLLVRRDRP